MIYETFRQAMQNVWSNKLRTFLTMLGIIIGVMAVIIITGLGNGVAVMLKSLYNTMDGDLLGAGVYNYGPRGVSVSDMYQITARYPEYFSLVSPVDFSAEKIKIGTAEHRQTTVVGTDENYFSVKKLTVSEGRGLCYADMLDCKNVCVVGDYVARVLCGGNAVGQTLKIGRCQYRIVGVLKAKVKDALAQEGSADDFVYVPYTTLMRQQGKNSVEEYYVMVKDAAKTAEAKAALLSELESRSARNDYIEVSSLSDEIQSLQSMIDMVVAVLTAIAGISLLVGGIGIMNIMLVSVTERTREIGIRKALGAREGVILAQFVAEAGVTSATGGALGIALGYLVSALANLVMPQLTAGMDAEFTIIPSFGAALVAFGISAGIGVLFGTLPAKRAARLDPIAALRYD